VARDGREAAAAAPPRRSQARHHLRPERDPARREHRGPQRQRRHGGDAAHRRGQARAGGRARDARCASAQALSLDPTRSTPSSSSAIASSGSSAASRATRRRRCAISATRSSSRPIRGLTIEGEGHRYYPGRELAGSVLGLRRAGRAGQGRPRARARRGSPRQGGGRARPPRPERAAHLRGGERRATRCRATT
jgi:hypothetical protein